MKKFFLMLIGAMMLCAVRAQVVEQGEPALVYYSPKTSLVLEFKYTVETEEPGIFAAYAESMIGAKNAIKETKTTYTLKDALVRTSTQTDYARPHKVTAEAGFPLLLTISEKGLLKGYNLPREEKDNIYSSNKKDEKPCSKKALKAVPFPEEVLKASTPSAQAAAAAKQIFHIRETRMYLLNGEVEHAPADGEAMRLVLEELNKQEKALTDLFLGKRSKRFESKRVRLTPEIAAQANTKTQKSVYYFSEENGFTDAENIDADTIGVTMVLNRAVLTEPAETGKKSKKHAPQLSQLTYNLPGNACIQVNYKNRSLTERTVPVAQLGADVPLSKDLFSGNDLPVIVFSEKTGNIVSISK